MSSAGRVQTGEHHEAWRPFALLAGVIALRSFVYFGLVTFIPLYYVAELHTGKAFGNAALSAMLLGGAVGTLIGGPLADRVRAAHGARPARCCRSRRSWSSASCSPARSGGVFAALAGAATIATFAVTIVMGQEYLPGVSASRPA